MNYLDLAELANHAAIEIDNYIIRRGDTFTDTSKFSDLLKQNTPQSTLDLVTSDFPHRAFIECVQTGGKPFRDVSSYALEMTLLRYELERVRELPQERLPELRSFLVSASRYFAAESSHHLRRCA